MKAKDLGRLARLVRQRARLTQAEVARLAGVGRWKVIDIEAGRLKDLSFGEVESCLESLGMRLVVRADYHGAEADRLLDQRHADLVAAITRLLQRHGWEVRVEVSFGYYGERGSMDVVGWHAATRTLLVIEVKSELGSVEATLRPLDVKCRLAHKVVRERLGWRPVAVARMLVFPRTGRCAGRSSATSRRCARRCRRAHATCGSGCASPAAKLPASGFCQMSALATLSGIPLPSGASGGQDPARTRRRERLAGAKMARIRPGDPRKVDPTDICRKLGHWPSCATCLGDLRTGSG